jgi:hypothetical protein
LQKKNKNKKTVLEKMRWIKRTVNNFSLYSLSEDTTLISIIAQTKSFNSALTTLSPSFSLLAVIKESETEALKHPEPVFLNVYGAQESIPRNEYHQPM